MASHRPRKLVLNAESNFGDISLISAIVKELLPHGLRTIRQIFGNLGVGFASAKGIQKPTHLEAFIKKDPHLFVIERNLQSKLVRLKTDLSVCQAHLQGFCPGDCGDLHFCPIHLLSSNCSTRRCRFGHKLDTYHNQSVLEHYDLDGLGFWQLQAVFRLPWVRRGAVCPRVCTDYNYWKGCTKEGQCTSLHLCRPYVSGRCKFGRGCRRNHNIFDEQVMRVLDFYWINTERRPKEILDELSFYDGTTQQTLRRSQSLYL